MTPRYRCWCCTALCYKTQKRYKSSTCRKGTDINPITPHKTPDVVTSLSQRAEGTQRSWRVEGLGSEGVNLSVN